MRTQQGSLIVECRYNGMVVLLSTIVCMQSGKRAVGSLAGLAGKIDITE